MGSAIGLVALLPWLALWVGAAVVAGARWSRHPLVSALVVTAAAINVLARVAAVVVPASLHEQGADLARIGLVSTAIGLLGLVGNGCLVAAVFVGRQDPGARSVTKPP